MTAVGLRAVTGKSLLAPRGRAPAGRYRAGLRRHARGGGRGIPWTAGERLSKRLGRSLRAGRATGTAGTLGSPHCVPLGIPPAPLEARVPGARSLNPPLKFHLAQCCRIQHRMCQPFSFKAVGTVPRSPAAWRGQTMRGCGLRSQGSSGALEVGCA